MRKKNDWNEIGWLNLWLTVRVRTLFRNNVDIWSRFDDFIFDGNDIERMEEGENCWKGIRILGWGEP